MLFAVRFDIQPGKIEELDEWIQGKGVSFWLAQKGVKSLCIYHDALVGYPERTLMVEVDSLAHLEIIQAGEGFRAFRKELLSYATSVSSQLLNRAYCIRPEVS